jgi:predicted ATPase
MENVLQSDEHPETAASVQSRAAIRGEEPSLIESFGIRGLYGYRTISLASEYAATILIARNGTGKTTLLGALDAFLRLQFTRLRNLEFTEIFCKLRGVGYELVLTNEDLVEFLTIPKDGEVSRLASRVSRTVEEIFSFLMIDYRSALREFSHTNSEEVAGAILSTCGWDTHKAIEMCKAAYEVLFTRSAVIEQLSLTIREALEDYEIVYLPTYRRVELALSDELETRPTRRRKRPRFSVAVGSLHTGDIQFGLSDISDRLLDLHRSIILRSNRGYREISENIIHELINGFDVKESSPIPSQSDLRLFFARLESGPRMMSTGYVISAPDFERIYSGEGVPIESRKFLSYFLGKLADVIRITQEIENPVQQFVVSCNKYLSSTEPTTSPPIETEHHHRLVAIDAKIMRINRNDLSVFVESIPHNGKINLDALSSGEKQMISLFAKLYLYPKKKIVLIDEPELSLSIDWQRGILVDVLLSPLCEQVIAIMHSPFVFDNSLEPFARSLILSVNKEMEPLLLPEAEMQLFEDDEVHSL